MKSECTFSIDFIIRLCKNEKSKALIYARVTVNGMPREISVKQKIDANKWDTKSETVRGNKSEVKTINDEIEKVRFRITQVYRKLLDENKPVTSEIIKQNYTGLQAPAKPSRKLLELVQYHALINKGILEPGTLKNYVATEKYLKNFMRRKFDCDDIQLIDLDFEFITEFEYHIRNFPLKKHDPCVGNGVYKHLERLMKMVSWSKKLKWIKENPFEDFELKFKKAKRKALSIVELYRLTVKKVLDPKLAYIKDAFIFSCYTGFSYADVFELKKSNLYVSMDGNLWSDKYREKSDELSMVPLLDTAVEIIRKYCDIDSLLPEDKIFRYVSNQEMNRGLKILREVCGIDKELTTHVARHTFATTVAIKNGVPISTVQKILGHAKLSTTEIYAQVDEETIEEGMSGVEEKLHAKMINAIKKQNIKVDNADLIPV